MLTDPETRASGIQAGHDRVEPWRYLSAAVAVARRDAQIMFSYRFGVVSQLLGAVFSLSLFYYLSRLVRVRPFDSPDAYYAFAVAGLVILQMLNSTLHGPPGTLRGEMVAGTFERIALSPFGPVGGLASALLFPFLNALVIGIIMLAYASLAFGMPVRWETAGLAVPVGVLAALAYAPFGLLLMSVVMIVKQATAAATWIVAGISIIAGLYFPVSLLPDWIRWATKVQPFTPSVDLLRNVLVGTPLPDPVLVDLARIVGFIIVTVPLSGVVLRWALGVSRKRGTLTEY